LKARETQVAGSERTNRPRPVLFERKETTVPKSVALLAQLVEAEIPG
jgi:hypothetical protein